MNKKISVCVILSLMMIILSACNSVEPPVVVEKAEQSLVEEQSSLDEEIDISDNVFCTKEKAEEIVTNLLPKELEEKGYHIIFDREVNFNDITSFSDGPYYRFLIEDDYIALESAFLVNMETGVATVCYPDDTMYQVRDEFTYEKPIWDGNYWADLTDDELNANCYDILTVSSIEEGKLYVTLDAYFGHGALKQTFDFDVLENTAVFENDSLKIELTLLNNNTIQSKVEKGSDDIKQALDRVFN